MRKISDYLQTIESLQPDAIDTNVLQLVEGASGLQGEQGISTVDLYVSDTAPEEPIQGTLWINETTGKFYIYLTDSSGSSQFIDLAAFVTPPTINTDSIHRKMWFLNG